LSPSLYETHNQDVDAFVLAGGRSSRMGRDKALIQLRGRSLVQHALGILRGAGLQPRIAGGTPDLSSYAAVIADEPGQSGFGPLSGILSALEHSAASCGLFLPVDMPLIPVGLISCLIDHAAITRCTINLISVAGLIQTFPAVIRRSAAPVFRASLQSNDRKCLKAFQRASDSASESVSLVPLESLLQAGQIGRSATPLPAQWFLNINTPEDLAIAESLLVSRDQVS